MKGKVLDGCVDGVDRFRPGLDLVDGDGDGGGHDDDDLGQGL